LEGEENSREEGKEVPPVTQVVVCSDDNKNNAS